MTRVAIVGGARTPVAKMGRAYRDVHPADLLAVSIGAALSDAGVEAGRVDQALFGATGQAGGQAQNVGRNAWLAAGLPHEVPAMTMDAQCPSSHLAAHLGAATIASGDASVVVVGGVESLTRVPMFTTAQAGLDRPIPATLTERWDMPHQGESAERAADRYAISRRACDEYGVRSHQAAAAAWKAGRFDDEATFVRADGAPLLRSDEGVRADSDIVKASALSPVYRPDGVNTAANSSQLSDGSAALVLASEEMCERDGLSPLAWIRSATWVGNDPDIIFDGPVDATEKVLDRAGIRTEDIALAEVHEAYAVPVLIWQQHFGFDLDRINVDGGAISIGHPFGASGARQMLHLAHALRHAGGGLGLATMCGGGGVATATIIESAV
ncbi:MULTISPECIES: thiolase family protein [Pseudonocardia]|uniref:Probable acetyl-CoA acetyltransferase n=2 Tax=Pseudonocardia TaxID=1847 RepID=A0A1Y2MKC3_PSEAH|nr:MULTISPECIES: thiolase family protein [Pseudonocardia]OSY35726.1 Acetyl-CoA acetyltransferase [Pseudonocardia autotrophica]TDN74583.1 acetyl-CoA C-acetyltransferase/acetyl-CoA acyltransferase [Pseudonocardia autotrophica]BBG05352.1 acetyl-CoA acyltransferase [Pseudonocardia autotrophica]GEC27476.1 acetyl-CoA acyltransferase [Pseudonocardia saturnea]